MSAGTPRLASPHLPPTVCALIFTETGAEGRKANGEKVKDGENRAEAKVSRWCLASGRR